MNEEVKTIYYIVDKDGNYHLVTDWNDVKEKEDENKLR